MSIGISDEHVELARSLREWAASLDGREAARDADGDVGATFADSWKACVEMGVATIGLPESYGGGGGSVLDAGGRARGVRARAGAGAAALDRGGRPRCALRRDRRRGCRRAGPRVPGMGWRGDWRPAAPRTCSDARRAGAARRRDPGARYRPEPPLRRRAASGRPSRATSSAVRPSRWPPPRPPGSRAGAWRRRSTTPRCASSSARPIGSFQAIKHLCAEMLETCRGGHRRGLGRRPSPRHAETTSSGRSPPTSPR